MNYWERKNMNKQQKNSTDQEEFYSKIIAENERIIKWHIENFKLIDEAIKKSFQKGEK